MVRNLWQTTVKQKADAAMPHRLFCVHLQRRLETAAHCVVALRFNTVVIDADGQDVTA